MLVTNLLAKAIRNPTQAPKMIDQHKPSASAANEFGSAVVNSEISEWVAVTGTNVRNQHVMKIVPPTTAPTNVACKMPIVLTAPGAIDISVIHTSMPKGWTAWH